MFNYVFKKIIGNVGLLNKCWDIITIVDDSLSTMNSSSQQVSRIFLY